MEFTEALSGSQLLVWRNQAREAAIANQISLYEVDWLLIALTSLNSLQLKLGQMPLTVQSACSWTELSELWTLRVKTRCPVQYLAGYCDWRDLQLSVSDRVLIPRPETEILVDLAQAAITKSSHLRRGIWVDLGTGSGAIAIALAIANPQLHIVGIDTSPDALTIAAKNGQALNVSPPQLQWRQGNWWEPLSAERGQIVGMISNPPYIPAAELAQLQPEVIRHEPLSALDGGLDGLDAVRVLVVQAPEFLISGGFWGVELMQGQARTVQEMLINTGQYREVEVVSDLAGIERFVQAYVV
ncbi:MAG: peptide chain release factor N(5)-glutamine methyltransferase [Cyanobacteria bacterium P01_H01_bin.15]